MYEKKLISQKIFEEWTEDLRALNLEEQSRFVFQTLADKKYLHIFGRFFFPHIIKGKGAVPDCHLDLIREISDPKTSAIVFPRGFSKSTWQKIDLIHDIVYGLEPVILYIGNSLGEAQKHFAAIKSELENNRLLHQVYGFLVPERKKNTSFKWSDSHFETTNGVNVVARGAGKGRGVNIKNQRPTKIVGDDIEDDELVRSADRRQKLNHWLYDVIFPSLDPQRGKIKMIGTIISPHCEILKFYKRHGGIFRKAIEDGESIWPWMWPMDRLMGCKEKIGSRAFSQEYLNTPINEETAMIKESWVKENMYSQPLMANGFFKKIIMFDPQAGESKTADYYGLCVLGFYSNEPHRYVMEIKKGRTTQRDQAALIVATYQKHKKYCELVGVEKIMTQVAVYQILLDWKAGRIDLPGVDNEDRNLPLIAVEPEGKDKVARMQMHEAAFERGEVHLHVSMDAFADQIISFPEVEHDDDVDSLIYCLHYANKIKKFAKTSNNNHNKTRTTLDSFGNIQNETF